MLNKDKIREEFEKEFAVWNNKWVFATRPKEQNTATTEDVFAHLSAQYEKLIGEVIPEQREDCELHSDDEVFCAECVNDAGFNAALTSIRTSLQERGIKIK